MPLFINYILLLLIIVKYVIVIFLINISFNSLIITANKSSKNDSNDNHLKTNINFYINNDSIPSELAKEGCINGVISCYNLALPLIELKMNKLYNYSLNHWRYNPYCNCNMPSQDILPFIQFFHIPKTSGTAFNYILHDYVGCPIANDSYPCEVSISTVCK